jgi:hypothetical protein
MEGLWRRVAPFMVARKGREGGGGEGEREREDRRESERRRKREEGKKEKRGGKKGGILGIRCKSQRHPCDPLPPARPHPLMDHPVRTHGWTDPLMSQHPHCEITFRLRHQLGTKSSTHESLGGTFCA